MRSLCLVAALALSSTFALWGPRAALAGTINDTSWDVQLADLDGDGDLDAVFSNFYWKFSNEPLRYAPQTCLGAARDMTCGEPRSC